MTRFPNKSRMAHALFSVAGIGAFLYLLGRFGIDNVAETARRAGWSFAAVMVVWLAIYTFNTLAWRLVLGRAGRGISFFRLFTVFVSGYALNTVTPFLAVGGEPYRATMLADTMGAAGSVSAVVLYRVINLFGHLLLLAAGVLIGVLIIPMSPIVRAISGAVFLAIAGLGYWVMTLHRDGIFIRLIAWFRRIKPLRGIGKRLERHGAELAAMDSLFTDAFRRRRREFVLAVGFEFLARAMMGLEVYIILRGAAVDVSFAAAVVIYVTYSLLINVIFFIPMNFGIRESGLILGLQGFAVPSLLGVYLGVVIRIRELFWVLLGLIFTVISTIKKLNVAREAQRV